MSDPLIIKAQFSIIQHFQMSPIPYTSFLVGTFFADSYLDQMQFPCLCKRVLYGPARGSNAVLLQREIPEYGIFLMRPTSIVPLSFAKDALSSGDLNSYQVSKLNVICSQFIGSRKYDNFQKGPLYLLPASNYDNSCLSFLILVIIEVNRHETQRHHI